MKVVIDTNVLLVSLSDRSPYHWIFLDLLNNHFSLCLSHEIVMEYTEIIERHMGVAVADGFLGVIENLNNVIEVNSYFNFGLITKDEDDSKFVDCAIASNADFILTEDKDFDVLKDIEFPRVKVMRIAQFKNYMEESRQG